MKTCTRNGIAGTLAVVVAGWLALVAPPAQAQPGAGGPSCDPAVGAASLEVLQGWLGELLSGNGAEALPEYWHPDATVTVPDSLPYGGSYAVPEQEAYMRAVAEAWELRGAGAPPTLRAACDTVFLEGRWVATARATGTRVDTPLLEVFTVRDGKIAGDVLYFFDLGELLAALEGSEP